MSYWPRKAKKKSTNAKYQEHHNLTDRELIETPRGLKVTKDVTVVRKVPQTLPSGFLNLRMVNSSSVISSP